MTMQYSTIPGGHSWTIAGDVGLEITGLQYGRAGQVFARVSLLAPDGSTLADGRIDLSNDSARYALARSAASRNGGTAADYSDALLRAWLAIQANLPPAPTRAQAPVFVPLPEFLDGVSSDAEYLVEGLFERGNCYLLAARYKTGKTILTMNLITAAARGGKWLGRDVQRGQVRWFQLEDSPRIVKRRWQRIAQAPSPDVWIAQEPWQLTAENLETTIRALQGTALVVVDPLIAATTIGRWEDMSEVRTALDLWRQVARRTNAVVLLTAHHRKMSGEDGDQVAGSHQIGATVDGIIELRKGGTGLQPNERRLSFVGRDWPDLDNEIIALDPETLVFESRGPYQDRRATSEAEKAQADAQELADAVAAGPEVQERLKSEVLCWNGTRFSPALKAAQAAGLVHRQRRSNPTTNRQVWYVVLGPLG